MLTYYRIFCTKKTTAIENMGTDDIQKKGLYGPEKKFEALRGL